MSGHTPDYDLLSGVIEKDAALTYKLLSIINTLAYYRGRRVSSVKQALVQMGIEETRRWIMILLLREVNSDNDELTKQSLLRAHFLRRLMNPSPLLFFL
jgi:Predicted signal transduction protein containing EAL and modified HD-GYP domains